MTRRVLTKAKRFQRFITLLPLTRNGPRAFSPAIPSSNSISCIYPQTAYGRIHGYVWAIRDARSFRGINRENPGAEGTLREAGCTGPRDWFLRIEFAPTS